MTRTRFIWQFVCFQMLLALMLAVLNPPCIAGRAQHHHAPSVTAATLQCDLDLSPVDVEPVTNPNGAGPAAAWAQKMHLENGVEVRGTKYITGPDVTTQELFILQITQSLEGGFDTVNAYDRGICSWGVMQWSCHSGSLDRSLLFIKNRLRQENRGALWHKLFSDNGLDVDDKGAGLILYGKTIGLDVNARRIAVRGSATTGNLDMPTATHWATVLARAGRQPEIQKIEVEYATKIVDGVLQRRLSGLPYKVAGRDGLTVQDLVYGDPYAAALVFVLWTNNPQHAWQYVADAAKKARSVASTNDPSLWPRGAFSGALLQRCGNSEFGNWRSRAAMIEARAKAVHTSDPANLTPFERSYQVVLSARKSRATFELASRHESELRLHAERLMGATGSTLSLAGRSRGRAPLAESFEESARTDYISPYPIGDDALTEQLTGEMTLPGQPLVDMSK